MKEQFEPMNLNLLFFENTSDIITASTSIQLGGQGSIQDDNPDGDE